MEINLHNYEAYFLDHKEGTLTAEQEKELFLFLELHPHLCEELDAFENVTLDDEAEVFEAKDAVKKMNISEEDLIAYTERSLSADQQQQVETLAAQNKALKRELALYASTRLVPDTTIVFKNKAALKKRGVVISLQNNYAFLRVAAAILLLAGLFFLVRTFNTKEDIKKGTELAEGVNKSEIESQIPIAIGTEVKNEKPEVVAEKNLAVNTGFGTKEKKKKIVGKNKKEENAVAPLIVKEENHNLTNNNPLADVVKKDTALEAVPVVKNNTVKENANNSYFNYTKEKDEDEAPVMAYAGGKKSFFQKIMNVAKRANGLGLKKVNATDEDATKSLSIGNFVVAETVSVQEKN